MLATTEAFRAAARQRGAIPINLAFFTNAWGVRLWSDRVPPNQVRGLGIPTYADGSALADGTRYAGLGTLSLLEARDVVLEWGDCQRSYLSGDGGITSVLSGDPVDTTYIVVKNVGGYISRIFAFENLVGGAISRQIGFPGLSAADYLDVFRGQVVEAEIEPARCTLIIEGN